MQWKVSMIVLTGLSVLFVTGCSVQREAVKSDVRRQTSEVVRDTVREQVLIAVHDTIREVTTITVQQNEVGDTIYRSVITDRDRVRDRAAVRDKEEKVIVKTDTVFVERRDSVFVSAPADKAMGKSPPAWVQGLKWVFWIVISVTVLVVIIKVSRFFRV